MGKFSYGSLTVYLGSRDKLKVRLVFYRLGDDVINQRKRRVREDSRRKGRTPSEKLLLWQEYSFFITNIEEADLSTEEIGALYGLRWQIELIFKRWKTYLRLDVLAGTKPERIEVFLYAKLIGVLVLGFFSHLLTESLRIHCGRELSEVKLLKFLIEQNALLSLFRGYLNRQTRLFLTQEEWYLDLCKQKRRRKTTLERITAQVSYENYFS